VPIEPNAAANTGQYGDHGVNPVVELRDNLGAHRGVVFGRSVL